MFQDDILKEHLETSSTITNQSLVALEWNMNVATNIDRIGNYRYRPTSAVGDIYRNPASSFDLNDAGNYYTNATYSDISIDGGFDDSDIPIIFSSAREKEQLLYSLEECFGRFRPRSGINKVRYFGDKFTHHVNQSMSSRPRYYMSHKEDNFKYWTSYRTEVDENGLSLERGISSATVNGKHYIDDASPFVVYKKQVPANRIIIKMQTNVGTEDLGPFSNSYQNFEDPLFGEANKTTPLRWSVQYLEDGIWNDAIRFDENSVRLNGQAIVKEDGYVELAYGLQIPEEFKNNFYFANTLTSANLLPDNNFAGAAYLIKTSELENGTYYVWDGSEYQTFIPSYGWALSDESVDNRTPYVTEFVNPPQFLQDVNSKIKYREFQYVQGIRVVAETMNKQDSTLDLIEMSPRLAANISDRVSSYSINRTASDLGVSGMPVGQLLAATGTLDIFDYDNAFITTNKNSIISSHTTQNLQVKFHEIIKDVNSYDYYVPIKTMYFDGFPEYENSVRSVSLELRDMFFYFESITAPELLITSVSLSYAISTLLDNIGFSNYSFLRLASDSDPIIPYFYVEPNRTVAEVLSDLAISTQYAMFFDEYNNFIVMSKNYIMPSEEDRDTDIVLYGSKDFLKDGVYQNASTSEVLANIAEISSQENLVYNNGKVVYSSRYIQRQYSGTEQASASDRYKSWVYRPVILWEGTSIPVLKTRNGSSDTAQDALAAIPINSNLSGSVPTVVGNSLVNNIIDLGEGVYYISRYKGYFYANGEIIKYDAVQYTVSGLSVANGGPNVWISSSQEYEKYFSQLPFNGKIYPTGLVRIYSEPNYEVINGVTRLLNGSVSKHGRGQFGTEVTEHYAGLDPYWTDSDNIYGCSMNSRYLFSDSSPVANMSLVAGAAGLSTSSGKLSNTEARRTSASSLIKNYLATENQPENEQTKILSTSSATVQASALVVTGKPFLSSETSTDFISYIPKSLGESYSHFGTRLRIIGKILNNADRIQSPSGSSTYYTVDGSSPEKSITIGASSGGLGVLLNPTTNNGYFFEIAALTDQNYNVDNVIFYKLAKNESYDYLIDSSLNGTLSSNVLRASVPGALSWSGSSLQVGERLLLSAQDNELENGYYRVSFAGSATAPWTLSKDESAIPVKLWGQNSAGIITDDGTMVGLTRRVDDEVTTVYDIAVEYEDVGSVRRFYLYINNRVVAVVDDTDPLPVYNNMALFVRGSARCMFENIYALGNNYAQNTSFVLDTPVKSVFSKQITASDSLKKYAISGFVQSAYLGGISAAEPPRYNIYYDEFGTIFREAAYYNIKYDKAYPALYSQLVHNVSKVKNLVISGFMGGAYGAEFLVFNATDSALVLNEDGANLAIHGVTITQSSSTELSVNDYFSRKSDFSDSEFVADPLVDSPQKAKEYYQDIKLSRITYGNREFSLDAKYVQSEDDAFELMSWMLGKVTKPRKSVGVRIFPNPTIQLGDIVKINYKDSQGTSLIGPEESRFVVYNIAYDRSDGATSMTIYLSEVL